MIVGAMPGDQVQAKVFRDKEGVSRGQILKVIEPSEYRQTPPCVHYESCGNCTVQHVNPDFYRHWKMEIVKEAFQKNNLHPRQWLPPFFLEGPHRRRATFTAVKSGGKIKMGYYRRRSQEIIDIDSCLVIDPKILELKNKIKPQLSKFLKENVPTDFFIQVVGKNIEELNLTVVNGSSLTPKGFMDALAKIKVDAQT
jgi:23S rRNA (uracil1939-C5)-methyltransferase